MTAKKKFLNEAQIFTNNMCSVLLLLHFQPVWRGGSFCGVITSVSLKPRLCFAQNAPFFIYYSRSIYQKRQWSVRARLLDGDLHSVTICTVQYVIVDLPCHFASYLICSGPLMEKKRNWSLRRIIFVWSERSRIIFEMFYNSSSLFVLFSFLTTVPVRSLARSYAAETLNLWTTSDSAFPNDILPDDTPNSDMFTPSLEETANPMSNPGSTSSTELAANFLDPDTASTLSSDYSVSDVEVLIAKTKASGEMCQAEGDSLSPFIGRLRVRGSEPGSERAVCGPTPGNSGTWNDDIEPSSSLPQVFTNTDPGVEQRKDICPPELYENRNYPVCSSGNPEDERLAPGLIPGTTEILLVPAYPCEFSLWAFTGKSLPSAAACPKRKNLFAGMSLTRSPESLSPFFGKLRIDPSDWFSIALDRVGCFPPQELWCCIGWAFVVSFMDRSWHENFFNENYHNFIFRSSNVLRKRWRVRYVRILSYLGEKGGGFLFCFFVCSTQFIRSKIKFFLLLLLLLFLFSSFLLFFNSNQK